MAPGGVEPPPADSKSAALSAELRGLDDRCHDIARPDARSGASGPLPPGRRPWNGLAPGVRFATGERPRGVQHRRRSPVAPPSGQLTPRRRRSHGINHRCREYARGACALRATPRARLRVESRTCATSTRTTVGSNCVPARRISSLRASSGDRASRYGRLGGHRDVGVARAHDARRERDLLAGETVGIAAAVPVLVRRANDRWRRCAGAGDARRMRSPTIVCWRTNAHSRSSSGPGLCRISSGTASLPEVVELRCARELVELVAAEPEHAPGLDRRASRLPRAAPAARARGPRERLEERGHRAVGLSRAASASARRDARRPPAAPGWGRSPRPGA